MQLSFFSYKNFTQKVRPTYVGPEFADVRVHMDGAAEILRSGIGIGLWAAFFWCAGRVPGAQVILPRLAPALRERSDLRLWVRFADLVLGIEQTLRSGWVPSEAQWRALEPAAELAPVGLAQCREALGLLRARGVALLPALARTREFALFMSEGIRVARARALPLLFQSWMVAIALPGVAFGLTRLLPELHANGALWSGGCALLWMWTLTGGAWMRAHVRAATRGGLRKGESAFGLGALLGMEAFRTSLESGHPPDLAWGELRTQLHTIAPELAARIPAGVFSGGTTGQEKGTQLSLSAQQLCGILVGFHQGIYLSVMEGRPCAERAAVSARLLRDELQAQRDAAFGSLHARLLVPLVLCGALPWLGLLALALGLAGWGILEGKL